jgi:hypothetical protein
MTARRRLTCSLTAALAAAALTAPAANAIPDYPTGPSPVVDTSESAPTPTVVVQADESSGFDWGSAGIGGGAAVAIVLLTGAAASTTVRHRRAAAR